MTRSTPPISRRSSTSAQRAVTVRDPLWDTIRVDPVAIRIVDSAAFQRLRHIRQLGLAHLVYPGATHTRFDHALGVYHLAQRALHALGETGALDTVSQADRHIIPYAALLHDIGHYPFSHALEELEAESIPGHHETVVSHFLRDADVTAALAELGDDAVVRVEALIRGQAAHPLQGLVSGSLDLDKIEYLKRDARFCGVPYGEVDVDRLLYGLMLLRDPGTGRAELGVHEKGVAALESLLFSKYQMFRNVYWHHAVRAATVLYKRVVADALLAGLIVADELLGQTDEGVLHLLRSRAAGGGADASRRIEGWIADLHGRRLPKRAGEVVAAELQGGGDWLEIDTPLKRSVEERLAEELGMPPASVYLDYPEKGAMFALNLLVQRRDGGVLRLGPGGHTGLIDLPRIADELYRTARVLRIFTHGARRDVPAAALVRLARRDGADVQRALARGDALLG